MELLTSRSTCSSLSALYPNPTFSLDVKPPSLTYSKFMNRSGQHTSAIHMLGSTSTAMYFATLNDTNDEVVVKFTARYNKKAHTLLADANLAPKLHFCEPIVGNLYMVVMDHVKGKSIWQLHEDKEDIPGVVLQKVKAAISCLHEANLVFGDLRDSNVLYVSSDSSAKERLLLVDFDWAEEDGIGRYPATLNDDNPWADGVYPSGIMRKTHDLWQVQHLEKECAENV